MRSRFCRFILFGLAIALASPSNAADGTYDLRWDSCTGPIERCPTADDQNSIFASVIGLDQSHKGYLVSVVFGDATNGTMPDAWQFDAPGCQDAPGRFRIDHLPMGALSKTCPALQGTVLSIQIKDVNTINPIYEYPEPFRQMVLANVYRDHVQTADPAKRYFLARFVFDHTLSVVGATTPGVDCGGFEVPMRFETFAATYLNAEDQEVSFGPLGNRAVTSKGSGTCVPMAARAATWGAIKGQYRR